MSESMVDFSEGWNKIESAFGNVLATVEGDDLFDLLSAGGYILLAESQELAPVDTGFLRASGQLEREGDSVIVGYAAEYAPPVEYGTSKMPAQPFLRPAMEETDKMVEAMTAVHKVKLDEAGK